MKFSVAAGSVHVRVGLSLFEPAALASSPHAAASAGTPRLVDDEAKQPSGDSAARDGLWGWLECQVTDTGCGIPQEGLRKLFQPYSQIRPGALQEGKGSGLGLSIAKKLVELHGGSIGASSEVGKGSAFFFRVPVRVLSMRERLRPRPLQPLSLPSHDLSPDAAVSDAERKEAIEPVEDERKEPAPAPSVAPALASVPLSSSPPLPPTPPSSSPTALLAPDSSTRPPPSDSDVASDALTPSSATTHSPTSASPDPPSAADTAASAVTPFNDTKGGEAPLRALVVEDSAVNRRLLVMILKSMKLQVDWAEDGLVCLNKIQRWREEQKEAAVDSQAAARLCPYDVVFMDDHMPNMTGVETTARLREMGLVVPIFGVTGNGAAVGPGALRGRGCDQGVHQAHQQGQHRSGGAGGSRHPRGAAGQRAAPRGLRCGPIPSSAAAPVVPCGAFTRWANGTSASCSALWRAEWSSPAPLQAPCSHMKPHPVVEGLSPSHGVE